ncbi:VOC family protein [Parasphingorhabdus sp.]|uniref:VOC family protein n=1 Tax=Parasphingorhabdus sp. TaxID=2709688 RepID=UPI003001CCC9
MMANRHGDFIWYELMTGDADKAQEFYSAVVGWTVKASDQPDMDYRLFSMAGTEVGGLMPLTSEMTAGGARPCWLGYIGVDDVDASVADIKASGGAVHMEPWDIPGVGRMAFVADPQGAPFYVMKGSVEGGDSSSFAATEPKPGHCAWNELATEDPEGAKTFYGNQFGWQQDGDMDMGPMGKYEFWKVGDDRGFMLGAVMPKMAEQPVSMWTYYFRVPDIDKAVETIKAKSGQLVQEPIEIPGGDYSLVAMDPQGAIFGLVGART